MSDKIKIVLVDDEPDLCTLVKANLETTDKFEVVTSTDPMGAEDLIVKEAPDVVLLDNVMAGKMGAEIGANLKEKDKNIPVVMISGRGEMIYHKKKQEFKWEPNNPAAKNRGEMPELKGAEELAKYYGVDDYVSKPFTIELLVGVIEEVVQKYTKKKQAEDEPLV